MQSKNPSPVAPLALLLALALPPAHALTLGEMHLHSFLGQPLRASVSFRLAPGEEPPEVRCLKLLQTEDNLPMPGRPVLRIREKDKVIEILSAEMLNEPLIGFVLAAGCDTRSFMRRYTAFVDPEAAPVQVATPQLSVKPATTPVPAVSKPIQTKPWPRSLIASREATASELAADVYPAGSARHRKLTRTLIAANPALAQPDATVPAGTKLHTRLPAPPKLKPAAKNEDRLTLVADDDKATTPAKKPERKSVENELQALREKVDTLQNLQLKMEVEIRQLHLTLDRSLAERPGATNTSPLAGQAASLPAVASAPPSTVALAAATASPSQKDRLLGLPFWAWLGGGFLTVGGFSFWLGRRGRAADGYIAPQNRVVAPGVGATTFNTRFGIAREPTTEISLFRRTASGGITVEEDESEIDRAQFLLAEGEVEEAINLLYKTIEENEHDIERWLILFHVFRERMMKTEYAQLAQRFKAMNPEEEDWDLVRNIGRKIDPDNPLYARTETAPEPTQEKQPAPAPITPDIFTAPNVGEKPLDFINKTPPSPEQVPILIDLELPSIEERGEGIVAQGLPELILPLPNAPEPSADSTKIASGENTPKAEDDFEKPCRY